MNETKIVRYSEDEIASRMKKYNCILKQYAIIKRDTDLPENANFAHYYRFVYFKHGKANIVCYNDFHSIEANMIGFVPPEGRIHVDDKQYVETYVISFELSNLEYKKEFEEFMRSIFPHQVMKDYEGVYREMVELIVKEGEDHKLGSEIMAQNVLNCLLIQLIRKSVDGLYVMDGTNRDVKGANVLYEQALAYINSHLDVTIRVNDMADALGVTPNYLYKIFEKRTGGSVSDFITDTKMEFAKGYLQNPMVRIKTIALELGYATSSHFSEVFKKHEGISPLAYRNQNLKKQNMGERPHVFFILTVTLG